MKTCFKCHQAKPITEFYKHPTMADGRLGKCKSCTKTDVRVRYQEAIEARHAYERARYKRPGRRAAIAKIIKAGRLRNPERFAARTAVSNAIKSGKLVKGPCQICGTTTDVQAHHADYSKPLDVEWLCFACHREERHGQTVTADQF